MHFKEIFKEAMNINTIENMDEREEKAKKFFSELDNIKFPEHFNWASEIFEDLHVKERGEQKALIWECLETGREKIYSYKTTAEKSNQFLNLIRKHKVIKGDNLYQIAPILPEIWFSSIAGVKGGIVIVPTAANITVRELEFRFKSHKPDIVLADEESTATMDEALRITNCKPKIKIVIGHAEGWESYHLTEKEETNAYPADVKINDIQFCYFTSGTTGFPKRVGHTAISYPIGHLSTAIMIGIKPGHIHHNISAPGWGKWAWSSFFAPLSIGATATGFTYNTFYTEKYLKLISRYQINSLCAPPTAWRMFVHSDLKNFDLTSLEISTSAGEPLNPEIIHQWKKITNIEIRELYGQTESTAMIGNPPWLAGRMKYGSFGYPSPMYDIAILDDHSNLITTPKTVGHIAVKVSKKKPIGLFKEYIGNPERMHDVFKEGYYHTGDKAYIDYDGYWWFVGRSDDIIKSSDYRIGPFEVESVLIEHSAVLEAAVIGVPDPDRYQLVKAFIVLKKEHSPSKEIVLDLFKHTIKILTKFKIPRIIEFSESLPKTTSGKTIRMKLRNDDITDNRNCKIKSLSNIYHYKDFPELSSQYKK